MSDQLIAALMGLVGGLVGAIIISVITARVEKANRQLDRQKWATTTRLAEKDRAVLDLYNCLVALYYEDVPKIRQTIAMFLQSKAVTNEAIEQTAGLLHGDFFYQLQRAERALGYAAIFLSDATAKLVVDLLEKQAVLVFTLICETPRVLRSINESELDEAPAFAATIDEHISAVGKAYDVAVTALQPDIDPDLGNDG